MSKTGQIQCIDGFRVGEKYVFNNGFYKGKIVILKWIAAHKQLSVNGNRYRQIRCQILGNKQFTNSQLDYLSPIKAGLEPVNKKPVADFSKLSNVMVIKLARLGNKGVTQEYIRRFKKLPRINK